MRTTLDITEILYGLVNVPEVTAIISGSTYRDERPENSAVQDVVCTSTTVDNEPFQEGVGYVNIHDPGTMPNHVWFKTVTGIIVPILKSHYVRNDYSLLVTNAAGPIKQEKQQGYFMSIRVRLKLYYNN
ncbi:hypothetical protein SAMN05444682_101773 [Parapedobacter indicus]|uniref:DUF3168 domain-containing protein n=2 Tax=Parapedobacter indicus TaxID=1477437 RepID=A0A1I3E698_9SPHI|nr:hypothetical protein CLV26_101787 [Parapedobacter indicus]SFH94221.1 hypothetical protein SAMN05444682_101773 [Parapedobacter indicus]